MKNIYLVIILLISPYIIYSQTNSFPSSGNAKIFATGESWAEGLSIVRSSGWSGVRFTRTDPALGNYNGNWAIGYNGTTGNDFSFSTNYNGNQYDGILHLSNSTRNVGIGTTSPASKLEVHGTTAIGQYTNGTAVIDAFNSYAYFGCNSATNGIAIGPSGNVGIGTVSPSQRMHISGSNAHFELAARIENTDANNDSFAPIQFKTGSSPNVWQTFARNGDLFSGIANVADYMVIKNGGNVGIGTSSPGAWFPSKALEIADTRPVVKLSSTSPTGLSTVVFTNSSVNSSSHNGEFHLNYQFDQVNNDKSLLRYYSYPGGEILALQSNGNVGIGTTNPGSYKLAVEGKIGAREVNVIATNPWPDYVFEKNYTLPTLESIKTYIDQNKHLPEVPSATEVEKNGVNLGEMNTLLLKKIEELTLYMIEANKKMENQQSKLEEATRKMENQQQQIEELRLTVKKN